MTGKRKYLLGLWRQDKTIDIPGAEVINVSGES
jgi:hypothetical protein